MNYISILLLFFVISCSHKEKLPEVRPTPTPTPVVIDLKEVVDCQGATIKGPVKVHNKDGYIIRNCKIVGYKGSGDPTGIDVRKSKNVLIENNDISEIKSSANAHGILVHHSKGIKILNNKLHDLELGKSEAISMHGEDFLIEGNEIWNHNNIGIDVMGCEGDGPGKNGKVYRNHVHAQKNGKRHAAGIYCDCCFQVEFSYNTVDGAEMGIEISSEKSTPSKDVKVMGNTLKNNRVVGLKVGAGAGVKQCFLYDNTFYGNKKDYIDEGASDCVAPR